MSTFKTVGIIAKRQDRRVGASLRRLCSHLRALKRMPLLDESVRTYLDNGYETASRRELGQRCDLVIVVGGDGTLLDAGRSLAPAAIPLLGINQGRLGFMVDVNPADMRKTLTEVFRGQFVRERRLLLSARIQRGARRRGPFTAINDVVIRNQAAVRMLEFETWLGTRFISRHRADGLIVSSPTGSTAYALSGGGPVLHPSLEAIALVPICPHTFSDRPIVVGCDEPVRIVLGGGPGTRAIFTCDGQINAPLVPGDVVEISRATETLELIHPRGYDYFQILRDKLHWGRGPGESAERA